jgi:hypothetical protein
MTAEEREKARIRINRWRAANPERARALNRKHKKARYYRGKLSPSDSPDRRRARVYACRAIKKFKAAPSASIASHLRKSAKDKNTTFVTELQEFHRSQRQARQEKEVKS